jgi:hypothetical protein
MRLHPIFWWSAILFLAAAATRAGDAPADTTPAPEAAQDPARAILREFFAAEDAARRQALAGQFAAVAPKSWADLRALLHQAAGRPPLKTGRATFEAPAADPLPAVKYLVRIPRDYKGDEPRGWPLVVGCHEENGSADAFMGKIEEWLGPDIEHYLVAVAVDPHVGLYKPDHAHSQYPLRVLADLRQRANIDSNRTVVVGRSKGGHAAWGAVLFAPGEWAGAVTISSFPLTEAGTIGVTLYATNLVPVAIQAHWGETDIEPGQKQGIATLARDTRDELKRLGSKKFEGIEYAGQGHNVTVQADKIRTFIGAAVRDPFPEQGHMIFHRLWQGRDFYVTALAAAKPEFNFAEKRFVKVESQEDVPRALRELFFSQGYELSLRLTPATNTLTIFARDLREIEVELPAEKIDFSRPVRIVLNGRTASDETRKVDYAELLETVRRTGDFERLVAGRVKLTVPPGE